MRRTALSALALLVLLVALAAPSPAKATTICTATMGALAFGSITDPSIESITTSTLSVRCDTTLSLTVLARVKVRMCLGIGKLPLPRTMSDGGTHLLEFQIYKDSARTLIWGTRGATPSALLLDMEYDVLLTGGKTQNITVQAATTWQPAAWAGNYSADYTASTALDYRFDEPLLVVPAQYPDTCTTGGDGGALNVPFGFSVSASVPRTCALQVTPNLDFGSHPGPIAAVYDNTTTLSMQCRGGTPWTLSLDNGKYFDSGTRRMRIDGTDSYVRYGLYHDTNRSLPWGQSTGDTLTGSGTGAVDTRTVYGRVPSGQNVPAGIYSDTVTATITY
jgi:spore coat protein U-like protein